MYLIHIKDILQNKEYIYNTNSRDQDNFENCIKFLKSQLPNENQDNIKYNIFQDYCEIYYNSEFKNKGWIWSSIDIRKDITYILTKIKILDTKNIKNNNVLTFETSTETETKTSTSTETETENKYNNNELILSNNKCNNNEFFKPTDKNNLNFICNYDQKYDQKHDQKYYMECLNNQRILSQHQLSSGYARNPIIPMWPDNFITELEEKFSTLNFGLSSTNPKDF